MRRELPVRPNLEHLKSQAKDLLHAARRQEAEALQRFRESLPAASGATDEKLAAMRLALHDAQSVIAREYGFASWAELRAHVERPSAETLRTLVATHLGQTLPEEVEQALLQAASAGAPKASPLPHELPLLPIRNALLVRGSVAPLSIGRASSIAAVHAAHTGDHVLAVLSQKQATDEAPGEGDLYSVGCAVHLISVVHSLDQGLWIVVRASQWIRLGAIEQRDSYRVARVSPFEVEAPAGDEVARLERALREHVRAAAGKLPQPELLLRMTERMNASELADTAIANLPCSVEVKARYAEEPRLVARLEYALSLVARAA